MKEGSEFMNINPTTDASAMNHQPVCRQCVNPSEKGIHTCSKQTQAGAFKTAESLTRLDRLLVLSEQERDRVLRACGF